MSKSIITELQDTYDRLNPNDEWAANWRLVLQALESDLKSSDDPNLRLRISLQITELLKIETDRQYMKQNDEYKP